MTRTGGGGGGGGHRNHYLTAARVSPRHPSSAIAPPHHAWPSATHARQRQLPATHTHTHTHTLVLVRAAHEHGHKLVGERRAPDGGRQLLRRDGLLGQEQLCQLVVHLRAARRVPRMARRTVWRERSRVGRGGQRATGRAWQCAATLTVRCTRAPRVTPAGGCRARSTATPCAPPTRAPRAPPSWPPPPAPCHPARGPHSSGVDGSSSTRTEQQARQRTVCVCVCVSAGTRACTRGVLWWLP
jgi:hypothetical protein